MKISQKTKDLIAQCALKNDEARKFLPISWTINQVIQLRNEPISEKLCFKFWSSALILTPMVVNSPSTWDILYQITKFNNFNKDNDPYGEHDFGAIEINKPINEGSYYFKIDYFENNSMDYGAENHLLGPCYRAITIMHSSEY